MDVVFENRPSLPLKINILTSKNSWMNHFDKTLKAKLEKRGHIVRLVDSKTELKSADISFFLSCFEVVGQEFLKISDHNIVVHACDLPNGKGWSPASWQILEGRNQIPLTLFEAVEAVDAGMIYLQDSIKLNGLELLKEWQNILGEKIIKMCLYFTDNYPDIIKKGQEQSGDESFYPRRLPKDSELDINKSIDEQFNLFRIVDNDKYPAFFIKNGKKYVLKIYEESADK